MYIFSIGFSSTTKFREIKRNNFTKTGIQTQLLCIPTVLGVVKISILIFSFVLIEG
jgi:hypothetical protein